MFRNKNKVSVNKNNDKDPEHDWLDIVLRQLRPITFNDNEYQLAITLIEQAFTYTK